MIPAMRLLAIQPGDVVSFLRGGKTLHAEVQGKPELRSDRKPGPARIAIEAQMRTPEGKAMEANEAFQISPRGIVHLRGDKILEILPRSK
jgi:hypothetical protein